MPNGRNSSFDRPVALSLATLMVIYCLVTALTYHKISHTYPDAVLSGPHPSLSISTTSQKPQRGALPRALGVSPSSSTTTAGGPEAIAELQKTFPIHVKDDMEQIVHPGLLAMKESARQLWPADLPRNLTVPKFFDDSHGAAYGGSIRHYLGDGKQLMTPELAATIGSKIKGDDGSELETIYCSVASYRDPECSGTVADVFERAKHPERIRVAIVDQRTQGDPICAVPETPCDVDPDQTLCKYAHLIDRTELDARWACGPVFARHLAHRHYRGEYFAMQIDAHVRFTENWDADLVTFWHQANNELGVLTTYLSDINHSIDPVTHTSQHPSRKYS